MAIITLDRPDRANAIDSSMLEGLRHIIENVDQDRQIRAAVITGAGDRSFCAGFDLASMPVRQMTEELYDDAGNAADVFKKMWGMRVPLFAAVNGTALGAGLTLALLADVVVASDRAVFGDPEIRHFILPPLPLMAWLSVSPSTWRYLAYTGDTFGPAEALRLGIVSTVEPSDRLVEATVKMAHRAALAPQVVTERLKESFRASFDAMGFSEAVEFQRLLGTILLGLSGNATKDRLFSHASGGQMRKFVAERDGPYRSAEDGKVASPARPMMADGE